MLEAGLRLEVWQARKLLFLGFFLKIWLKHDWKRADAEWSHVDKSMV